MRSSEIGECGEIRGLVGRWDSRRNRRMSNVHLYEVAFCESILCGMSPFYEYLKFYNPGAGSTHPLKHEVASFQPC